MAPLTLLNTAVELEHQNETDGFLVDVLQGLTAKEKHLNSKYFYDETGDRIFQKIMACPEYYLTRCEMEIFKEQIKKIASTFTERLEEFDIIELGAGDATKSIHLLEELLSSKVNFTYYPADISENVIQLLHKQLPKKLPSLKIEGLNGEYFKMLEKAKELSNKTKVVLFLGGNIGNITLEKVEEFCKELRSHLSPGDIVLIGFDLKKNPQLILDAYNDKGGLTRDFNLNLLKRINQELDADFDLSNFQHYPMYDPSTGTCKSYLISKKDQKVQVEGHSIFFKEGEPIHTEISQKYTIDQIDQLATRCNFIPIANFYDSKKWFVDVVWQM